MTDNSELYDTGIGKNQFDNEAAGTVIYDGSSSSASADIQVNGTDSGAVDVGEGSLSIGDGAGPILAGSPSVQGPGTLSLYGATLPGTLKLVDDPGLQFTGSTTVTSTSALSGVSTVAINGSITGGGTLTLPSGTTSTVNAGYVLQDATTLVNNGTMTVSGTDQNYLTGGSTLENAGTLTMTDNSELYDTGIGKNQFDNEAAGTVIYDGSSSSASADIHVPFENSGSVDVGEGTLTLSNYPTDSASTLTIGISSDPGALSVSGKATLKGTLAIANVSGYLPKVGKKITILTAGSRKGTFSTITGTQLTGEHWVVSYTAKSVVLTMASG
jgi:hypothetical protein